MSSRRIAALSSVMLVAMLLTVQAASAQTYTITVATDSKTYIALQKILVTGSVSPAPPSASTAATIRICYLACKPGNTVVAAEPATVSSSTGAFNYTFVAGGPNWVAGTYTVNATWGAYPPTIFHAVTFNFSLSSTTTTTTTTSTSSSSTSSTSSSTSSSSSSSSTSTTSTSSTSTSSTTTSSSSTSSTTSSSSGGGIPEFPFQASFAGLVVAVIAVGYLLVRRTATQRPIIPSPR